MCELMVVRFDSPRGIGELFPLAQSLERYGVAGFGWGVAWLSGTGVTGYGPPVAFADDRSGRRQLTDVKSKCYLLHLRRPSQLTTYPLRIRSPSWTRTTDLHLPTPDGSIRVG